MLLGTAFNPLFCRHPLPPRCDLYVSCEPCIMCAAALSLLGFRSVTYGCECGGL